MDEILLNSILEKHEGELLKPRKSKNDVVLEKFIDAYNEHKKATHFEGICAVGYNKEDKTEERAIVYVNPDLTDKILKITKQMCKELNIIPDRQLFGALVQTCMVTYISFTQFFTSIASTLKSKEFDEETRDKIVKFHHAIVDYVKNEKLK